MFFVLFLFFCSRSIGSEWLAPWCQAKDVEGHTNVWDVCISLAKFMWPNGTGWWTISCAFTWVSMKCHFIASCASSDATPGPSCCATGRRSGDTSCCCGKRGFVAKQSYALLVKNQMCRVKLHHPQVNDLDIKSDWCCCFLSGLSFCFFSLYLYYVSRM